ncbi:Zn-finger protein (plasmid) [Halalkaliarchaeum sp. AArc-CO]|nr:Zn-finger protein [Halalkaliarchaeum sp. AArc-CO]
MIAIEISRNCGRPARRPTFRTRGWTTGVKVPPDGNASRRALVVTLMRRRQPTASADPVGRQSQTTRQNVGSVSPTISGVTPLARTSQRRRRFSGSSTWSSSRPRSTAPWRRAAPLRASSPPTWRSRPSTTTRSSTISTRRRLASWSSNGPHSPRRYKCRQERVSGFSVPPVTGLGGTGRGASERQEQVPTRLYDQRGDGILDASRLDAVLDDADDVVWLVPAMALTESTDVAAADRQVSSVPTALELDCRTCGRATDHRFRTHESVPDEAWTGQPIWECRVCGSARYGPSLE